MTPYADLAPLVAAMRRNDVTELRIEDGDRELSLRLEPLRVSPPPKTALPVFAVSPEMGRFMTGAKSVGDEVEAGEIVAFTVLGPIRLPIVVPTAGVIAEQLVSDGAPVGYHARVLRIESGVRAKRPSAPPARKSH